MKAYEVIERVQGGYNGQTITKFVKANSIKELKSSPWVKKVYLRKDLTLDDCEYEYDKETKMIQVYF